MDGILTSITPYNSKTTTQYKGRVYKCVFKCELPDGTVEEDWSLQAFTTMRNYKLWEDLVDSKLAQPGKWFVVSGLRQLGNKPKTLDADYKPTILGSIDNPNKGNTKPKVKPTNNYQTLFDSE